MDKGREVRSYTKLALLVRSRGPIGCAPTRSRFPSRVPVPGVAELCSFGPALFSPRGTPPTYFRSRRQAFCYAPPACRACACVCRAVPWRNFGKIIRDFVCVVFAVRLQYEYNLFCRCCVLRSLPLFVLCPVLDVRCCPSRRPPYLAASGVRGAYVRTYFEVRTCVCVYLCRSSSGQTDSHNLGHFARDARLLLCRRLHMASLTGLLSMFVLSPAAAILFSAGYDVYAVLDRHWEPFRRRGRRSRRDSRCQCSESAKKWIRIKPEPMASVICQQPSADPSTTMSTGPFAFFLFVPSTTKQKPHDAGFVARLRQNTRVRASKRREQEKGVCAFRAFVAKEGPSICVHARTPTNLSRTAPTIGF